MLYKRYTKFFIGNIILVAIILATIVSANATSSEVIVLSTDSHHITIGGSTTVIATTNPSGLYVTWISTNTTVASVSSTGVVTGLSAGTTTILAYCYNPATSSTYTDTLEITVHDNPIGLVDGETYYISNFYYAKFITSAAYAEYANMYLVGIGKTTTTFSQWELDYQPDGTVQIINNYSPSNQCMTVNGSRICITYDTESDNQKFILERNTAGFYPGYYFIRYRDKYLSLNSNNEVVLTTIPSLEAHWSFSNINKNNAQIFSNNYTGTVTNTYNNVFVTTLDNAGYTAVAYTNQSALTAYNNIDNDDIFVFIGHGAPGRIAFHYASGAIAGRIIVSPQAGAGLSSPQYYISDFSNNALANLRIVLYIGCETGVDVALDNVTYNLVDETYEKGAHFVLGTTQEIYQNDALLFLNGFLDGISKGLTVGESINNGLNSIPDAKYIVDNQPVKLPLHYIGDDKQYLD